MNKQDFMSHLLNWYKDFNIKKEDCFVSHGGAMLMMGLRSNTDDIDLNVTEEIWDKFISLGYEVVELGGNGLPATKLISVTDKIDIHLVSDFSDLLEEGGVYFTSPERTIQEKKLLMRDKDIRDIKTIEAYLTWD